MFKPNYKVIQHSRVCLLGLGASRDPHKILVASFDVAIYMTAICSYAEYAHGRSLNTKYRLLVELGTNIVVLVSPTVQLLEQPFFFHITQSCLHCFCFLFERVKLWVHGNSKPVESTSKRDSIKSI